MNWSNPKGMKNKIGRLDWMIYRIFRWRWNPIFLRNADVANAIGFDILLWRGELKRCREQLKSLIKRPRKDV